MRAAVAPTCAVFGHLNALGLIDLENGINGIIVLLRALASLKAKTFRRTLAQVCIPA
jgi:hypothetical protein